MGIKSIIGAVCTCLLVVSFSTNASTITHGALSSNDTTNIITDSLNNVEYLRFDVIADLTYAQTLTILDTQEGGGWSIATSTDALDFMSALLNGSSSCTHDGITATVNNCGSTTGWFDGDFGADQDELNDSAWFLDDNGNVDIVRMSVGGGTLLDDYGTIIQSDRFATGGINESQPIGWLVVRTSAVPVPAAAWLFGSGLLGLVGLARRKA